MVASSKSKTLRIIEHLEADAPDRYAALQRLALQTGLALEALENPDSLTDEQRALIEEAAKRILGVDTLEIEA